MPAYRFLVLVFMLGSLAGSTALWSQTEAQSTSDILQFELPNGRVVGRIQPGNRIEAESADQHRVHRGRVLSVGDSSLVIEGAFSGRDTLQLARTVRLERAGGHALYQAGKVLGYLGIVGGSLTAVILFFLMVAALLNPLFIAWYTAGLVFLIFVGLIVVSFGFLRRRWRPLFPGLLQWRRVPKKGRARK